jgi:hypothetical protein
LQIAVLDADVGYSTYCFVALLSALGASPVIDDNLRRQGKRLLAMPLSPDQWQGMGVPRSVGERSFTFLTRHSGLMFFQAAGRDDD